jgi:L-ascorbate metabolism protein UlaG (beta-lactamase superfamily)
MKKIKKRIMLTIQIISGILLTIIFTVIFYVKLSPQFGAKSKGESLDRILNSPNFQEGKFQNLVPTTLAAPNTSMFKNGLKFMKTIKGQYPQKAIETIKFNKNDFVKPSDDVKICWLGHSCLIMNIDGKIILTDPVFSEKASPVSFAGVKRFEYTNQYDVDDMPQIDLLLISHDHYDHLDYKTIKRLSTQVSKFCVPLGVAAHLMHWGVPKSKIIELDWSECTNEIQGMEIFATPSRHFSGRAGVDRDNTLWCSFVIKTEKFNVFFCGDSGYGDHFKEIGKNYGPFDLTLMECGQYNEGWPFIHMNPEESVKAHIDLKGQTMLPIHWGKFKLSLHTWTEPIERAKKEAERLNVKLINSLLGEIFMVSKVSETALVD